MSAEGGKPTTRTVTLVPPAEGDGRVVAVAGFGQFGPYRIERLLGTGGMGVVFAATDERYGNRVAIKTISTALDEVSLRALKREFRLMGEFAHQNVVQIYGLHGTESAWYVVMELIEGQEFFPFAHDALRESSGVDRVLSVFGQVAMGLDALHKIGRVHRDLKSSNVLVETGTDRAVILDFGLVEALENTLDRESRRLGTPSHMAPELLRDGAPSSASDWYAVGVMLAQAILTDGSWDDLRAHAHVVRAASDGSRRRLLDLSVDLLSDDPEARPRADEVFRRLEMAAPQATGSNARVPFEGRAQEMAMLVDAWHEVQTGTTAFVEIEGAAGMGKTALVQAFLSLIERDDVGDVLQSRCHVNEQIPFKAVDHIVESIVRLAQRRLGEGPAAREWVDALPHIASLFPALADLHPSASELVADVVPKAQRRAEVFARLRGLFHTLARVRPLVIFIDDVHWGDADSVQLLHAVLRSDDPTVEGGRILVVWTHRPGADQSSFLAEARRSKLYQGHQVRRVQLEQLDAAAAERLVRSLFENAGERQLQKIIDDAGGNPLIIVKAAHSPEAVTHNPSEPLLDNLVEADLRDLTPAARDLVDLLAIARVPISVEVAVRAVGHQMDVNRILAVLSRARLIVFYSEGGIAVREEDENRIELYHDQLREPIVRRIADEARTRLHGTLARSIEVSPQPDPGLLATHFHAAGELGRAADYAERAGHRASASLAFLAAAQHFRQAIEWVERSAADRQKLQEQLADSLFNAGHCSDSARAYETARQALPAAASPDLTVKESTAWFVAGHVDRGLVCIRPLLRQLRISPPRNAFLIPTIALKLSGLQRRGADIPLEPGGSRNDARAFQADVCWSMGQGMSMFLSRIGAFFGVQSLIEAIASRDGHRVGRALAFAGGISVNLGGRSAAWGLACLDRAEAFATEQSSTYLLGWCHVWRANAHLIASEFDAAIEEAERGIDLIERGPYAMSWECHTARCFALMARERRGDLAGVERAATQVFRLASTRDDLYGQVVFSLFLAYVAFAAGKLDEARELARSSMAGWTRDVYTIQHFYALRIEAYCDIYEGHPERARQRLDAVWTEVRASDVPGLPSSKMEAALLQSHVELALAKKTGDRAHLRSARRHVRAIDKKSREGRGHASLLRASIRLLGGRHQEAAREAAAAGDLFEKLGMRIWACVARHCQGVAEDRLLLVEEQRAELFALGIMDPPRWLRVVAPGFVP